MKSILTKILYAVIPIIAFCLMESFGRNPFAQIRQDAFLFNVILFEVAAWLLYLLTNRPRISLTVVTMLSMVWGLANHYVYAFRSTPLMPWDFYSVRTAASVAGNYDFTLDGASRRVVLGFAALLLAIWGPGIVRAARQRQHCDQSVRAKTATGKEKHSNTKHGNTKHGNTKHGDKRRDKQESSRPDNGRQIGRLGIRVGIAVCLCALAIGLCRNLQDDDFQTRHSLYPFLFTPNVLIKYNGIAVSFVMEMKYLWVDKPDGYDAEEAAALLETYASAESDSGSGAADEDAPSQSGERKPTIIAIMDEAFSDLAVLGDFPVSEDYMPFVHSMMDGADNTISGMLHVSVCGGNTANTEFEFLTGNTMAFLPAGSIPYQQYIRRELPSLASVLKEQGYATYAQHPYYSSGWERQKVYPLLGFGKMDFLPAYKGANRVRSYVDDATCFSHIIETFENKPEDRPAFIFNVTMQNHGGYTDTQTGFTNTITSAELKSQPLDQYLSLLKLTDQYLEALIDYFRGQDEPVMVVFFGDHQPNDTVAGPVMRWVDKQKEGDGSKAAAASQASDEDADENPLRYQVPYFIWANFDLEEETGADTSANYLGCHVMKAAGLELSPYQSFLMEQESTTPLLSAVRQSGEELQEYRLLQYYQLFDREATP